jgi:hypothetical protein
MRVLRGDFSGISALIERLAQPKQRERESQQRVRSGQAEEAGYEGR